MNLRIPQSVVLSQQTSAGIDGTRQIDLQYLLRTPRNVLSLELSSGGFSTGAFAGVDALEGWFEVVAELGCEALGAASEFADDSAMFG